MAPVNSLNIYISDCSARSLQAIPSGKVEINLTTFFFLQVTPLFYIFLFILIFTFLSGIDPAVTKLMLNNNNINTLPSGKRIIIYINILKKKYFYIFVVFV